MRLLKLALSSGEPEEVERMRRNWWKWILGALGAMIFVILLVWVVMIYTGQNNESSESFPSEMVIVKTIGVGNHGELIAYVSTPGKGSLTWYSADGSVVSGTDTWNEGTTGDIGMMPISGKNIKGAYPVLTTSSGERKGEPLK